ncbi:sigma factor, partial [Acinetobacter nosocomialis]
MLMHSSEPTLGEVFIANRAQLQRVAQKIVRTADLADEVLQDAYLKLADGAAVRDVRKPLGYCCQVVRNVAFDYHRHQSVEASYRTYCEDVELVSPPSNDAPERVLDGRQALAVIDRVLGALPARTRLAFELNRL